MAIKKGTPAAVGVKPASAKGRETQQRTIASAIAASTSRDPRRLMREAAWARMFGRTESKNPFAR